MKTEGIGNSANVYQAYQAGKNQEAHQAKNQEPIKALEKVAKEIYKNPMDTYTPSVEGAADPKKIESLWKETNHMGEAVKKLLASALGIKDGTGQGFWVMRAKDIQLSEDERAEAEKLIGEDGYFGVVQTSARIMDFAKALVGEGASSEKIEQMRKAVQKGFDDVAKMFGGFDKLPDVTKDTYDSIMKSFDEWAGIGVAPVTTTEE